MGGRLHPLLMQSVFGAVKVVYFWVSVDELA